ncbi:thiamine-phosphate kinase [Pirellulimonas nuda]|uniref:thiamine-phosphate kinase n=1 Tax=Pirellulimonas nuda TaxID=2528009 RepID=UPI0011AAACC7|nr:thiamine-phosphate kinase [Pirellulimonas nuda]
MEDAFVQWLRDRLPASPRLKLGPGDDAAVLAWGARRDLVVSSDLLAEGVHFDSGSASPQQIGHKALAVNLSDLAAMAATPVAAVVSLLAPREGAGGLDALALCQGLYAGLLPLAERFDLTIAGGDTNTWSGGLVIDIVILGEAHPRGSLTRAGAAPGDALLVTGPLGGSLLGAHLDFAPRVREAIALRDAYELHAGMDITDGLSLDLSRLAEASGVGAVIDLAAVPIDAAAVRRSAKSGRSPLEHALSDGEDFELLLAAPPAEAQRILREQPAGLSITQVGECVAGAGLQGRGADGTLKPLPAFGYLHR